MTRLEFRLRGRTSFRSIKTVSLSCIFSRRNIYGILRAYENTSLYSHFPKRNGGGYTVIIPALKGCVTYGETIEEAASAAKEAIDSYLGSLAKDGESAPKDISFVSTIDVPEIPSHPASYV